MNELSAFERRLTAGLEAYAGPRQAVDAIAIARTAASRTPVRRPILSHFWALVSQPARVRGGHLGGLAEGRGSRPLVVLIASP